MKRFGATIRILGVVLGVTAVVAGCAANPPPADEVAVSTGVPTEDAGSVPESEPVEADEGSGDVDPADIVELPEDFPASVPLHPGPITWATSLGEGSGYWQVHVRVSDSAAAMQSVRTELPAAGFEEQSWGEAGTMVSGKFTTPELRVSVQNSQDIDGEMLMYSVLET